MPPSRPLVPMTAGLIIEYYANNPNYCMQVVYVSKEIRPSRVTNGKGRGPELLPWQFLKNKTSKDKQISCSRACLFVCMKDCQRTATHEVE